MSAVAVFTVAHIVPHIHIDDYLSALLVAVVLAFLNTVVRPILTILTIPITIFTLGFFLLVINAVLILLAGKLVPGFHVDGFFWALIFSLVLSLCTSILHMLFGVNDAEE